MLRPDRDAPQVYLYRLPIDMRKQRNGLAALVQEMMSADPFGGAIFVFVGKRFDRIKILCCDGSPSRELDSLGAHGCDLSW